MPWPIVEAKEGRKEDEVHLENYPCERVVLAFLAESDEHSGNFCQGSPNPLRAASDADALGAIHSSISNNLDNSISNQVII